MPKDPKKYLFEGEIDKKLIVLSKECIDILSLPKYIEYYPMDWREERKTILSEIKEVLIQIEKGLDLEQ